MCSNDEVGVKTIVEVAAFAGLVSRFLDFLTATTRLQEAVEWVNTGVFSGGLRKNERV